MAAFLLLSGSVLSAYQVLSSGGVRGGGLALILAGINIACFGLLADQIAIIRRKGVLSLTVC